MQGNDNFLDWCEAAMFEAELHFEYLQGRWNGIYFEATEQQKTFALSVLERLILPDNIEKWYIQEINSASVEYCAKLINRLQSEFDSQTTAFNPQKQFIYFCKHE